MLTMLYALALQAEAPGFGFSTSTIIIWLAFVAVSIGGMWMTFQKAGQPGWAAIVPIYNIFVMTRVARKPGWWTLLFFVPLVNFVVIILVSIEVAKNFGRGSGFGVGLAFLAPIFYGILGYGDSEYQPAI